MLLFLENYSSDYDNTTEKEVCKRLKEDNTKECVDPTYFKSKEIIGADELKCLSSEGNYSNEEYFEEFEKCIDELVIEKEDLTGTLDKTNPIVEYGDWEFERLKIQIRGVEYILTKTSGGLYSWFVMKQELINILSSKFDFEFEELKDSIPLYT